MTDSMKFGPEWLRNMNSDPSPMVMSSGGGGGGGGSFSNAVSSNNSSMTIDTAPIIMAQFRYGREEMLLLFNRCNVPPDPLKNMQGLYVEKKQMPINLITLTEEETRMWNRGINSDAALRLAKPGSGPGVGIPGTRGALGSSRGGSVDRGRGRARGSYHYSRGLSYEDPDNANGFNSRGVRSYDRTQSQSSWAERNGGDAADYTATSPRKEFGSRSLSDTNWRRHRTGSEDDDTWRNSRSEKWGRSNTNSWRESDNNWERPNQNNNHLPQKKTWEGEEHNLPEWAMENPSERGGSFDASGAFHGGSTYSDDDEGEGHPKSESAKNNSGTSQPRPTSQSKKEPPNIPNGSASDSSSTGNTTLKQSQSATSLSTERRPTNHPITTSASFSGVEMHTSQSPRSNKPSRREEVQSKASPPIPHQTPQQPAEAPHPIVSPPVVEPKVVTKTSQEEEIEQRLLDAADVFVSRLMDEEDKDPPKAPLSSATPPTTAATPAHSQSHPHTLNDSLWYYQDPQGNVQGPFQSAEMAEWFSSGYFKGTLLVRRACDERYSPLSELMTLWDGVPFIKDYYQVPPIKNTEPVVPIIDEALLLQVQLQQQQRLLMQRNQAALAKLSQSDHYNNLTVEQQQQLLAHQAQMELNLQAGLMNPHARTQNQQPQSHTNANVLAMMHQLAQAQYHPHPQGRTVPQVSLPVPSPAEPSPDPLLQLMQQLSLQTPLPRPSASPSEPDQRSIEQFMNAFRQRQVNPHTMESVWGGTNSAPNFTGWSAPPGHSSLWVDPVAKGIKTEQEVLEEQLRAEEKKKEELRKQEELQRIKEEEERKRRLEEEELERRRKEEEEREKEKERKRIQEEEERRKKEAAAAKKAEQDRLRKEEEKKRKEEEKRRKEEEKRKQEEEKKRVEEEKKRLEEERKKREEMTKRQNEALKRLQEQQQQQQQQQQQARTVKAVPAPWTAPETAGASLADIQKIERKQQQQLREQQEMLKAYQEKHQQEQQLKNSSKSKILPWADPVGKNQSTRVKSLAEIQAEEHERMIKQAEKEKAERIAAAKDLPMPIPGATWSSVSQNHSWNSAPPCVWGTPPTAVSVSEAPRFFDEVSAKAAKPQAPLAANKSQAKTKAKREEASVMKLFEKQLPKSSNKSEEFNRWCSKTLASCHGRDFDIPTFVDFLLTFESQKEIREYVQPYLDKQEAENFASEFVKRRSRLLSADQPLGRLDPPAPTHSNHFQEVKGKNKKKGKMTKVDSRILGFNVTAAPDRINVGDRDYGEGL